MRYADTILENTCSLLGIPSPTGYCRDAVQYVFEQLQGLGYAPVITQKGGVLVSLGGDPSGSGILLETHLDTLGAMVSEIKSNGRLRLSPIGGMNANNAETENVQVLTKFHGSYEGTVQLCNASTHVNGEYSTTGRTWDTVELVLDEDVSSRQDVCALGISAGDYVIFDPRTRITKSGYIKSRFLDDKLSVGILLTYARRLKEEHITPIRPVWGHITVFEEVGHGGSASVPDGVSEVLSIDMGCVGEGLQCTEKMVSICAKDSGGPYHYDVVRALIQAAQRHEIPYAVDVYPHYGSDAEATLRAGYDLRHGLIGAGVYASHGYERSHRDGAENVFRLLCAYLEEVQ